MREEKLRVACHMKTYDAKAPARAFVSKAFFLPRGAGQFSAVLASGASGHRLYLLDNCSVVVGVPPNWVMYGWCRMLGGM